MGYIFINGEHRVECGLGNGKMIIWAIKFNYAGNTMCPVIYHFGISSWTVLVGYFVEGFNCEIFNYSLIRFAFGFD